MYFFLKQYRKKNTLERFRLFKAARHKSAAGNMSEGVLLSHGEASATHRAEDRGAESAKLLRY